MKINHKQTVALFGKINYETIVKPMEKMVQLWEKNPSKEVTLLLSSGGGMVDPSFMFVDMVNALKVNLTTLGSGGIGSMAVILFMAGRRRLATRHTDFFLHELGNTFDKDERLSTTQVQAKNTSLSLSQNWYTEFVAEHSRGKISKQKVLGLMKGETYLTPQEAKRFGFVDEII